MEAQPAGECPGKEINGFQACQKWLKQEQGAKGLCVSNV